MATKTVTITGHTVIGATVSVKTFSVTFNATNHVTYTVIWTSGGLGTSPSNLSSRRAAYTYNNVPYGAKYTVNYGSSGGWYASANSGTITAATTVTAPTEKYSDYSDYTDYSDFNTN